MKFSENQLQAINARNTNVIVSASAGAGKTTLLVERLKRRIVEDHVSIDQILAMTFTSKAAAEMKNRLSKSLTKLYQKEPHNLFLKEQLELLPSAQISTIHSFCLSIIKEFGFLLSIDPQALDNILDDKQINELSSQAKQRTLDRLLLEYKDDQHFKDLLNYFSFKVDNYNELSKAFILLYEKAMVQLDPIAYYERIINIHQSQSFNQYPDDLLVLVIEAYESAIDLFEKSLNHLNELFLMAEQQVDHFEDWLAFGYETIAQMRLALKSKDIIKIREVLFEFFNQKLKNVTKQDYSKARTKFISNEAQKILTLFMAQDDMSELLPYIKILVKAAKWYGETYFKLKKESKSIDFNDIEHLAYQLLKHESNLVRETLQSQYQEIMIDEFQDTNNYQNEIANLISNGHNVFRVGDVKQSIYGFRNARPDIMMDIINSDDNHLEKVYLTNNYRSSYPIVEFGNVLFKELMNVEGSNMRYSKKDEVSIGDSKQKENTEPVEIHLIDKEQLIHYKTANASDFKAIKIKNELRIAYYIAQDILKKHQQGIPFKDMSILVRSHSRKYYLKRAFEELGVPYYIEDKDGFYHAYSVQDVTHFIKFMINPHDNIALLWVLQSGFINYTENQMALLKLEDSRDSLFNRLKAVDPKTYQQLNQFLMDIEPYSDLDKVLSLIHFNNYYQQHLNSQERTNIDLYISDLYEYSSKPNDGLIGFLKQVEFSIDTETSTAASISEIDDVIKVHTVHQSKGLEYPITYFFAFKADNKDKNLWENLLIDDLGCTMYHFEFEQLTKKTNLLREIIGYKKQQETIFEEIRNLYVTLTRARDKLIIVDINQNISDEPISIFDLMAGDNYTKLILKSLPAKENAIYKIFTDCKVEPVSVIGKKQTHRRTLSTLSENLETFEPLDYKDLSLSLNLQTKYATAYGTKMHEIISKLPHRPWQDEDLSHIEASIKQKLMAYNQHPMTISFYPYPISHEVPLAYRIDDKVNYGYMDMLVEKDDEIIMVDFKTDQIQSLDQLVTRYQNQMSRYKKGLDLVYPTKKISLYLYSFALNDYILVQGI